MPVGIKIRVFFVVFLTPFLRITGNIFAIMLHLACALACPTTGERQKEHKKKDWGAWIIPDEDFFTSGLTTTPVASRCRTIFRDKMDCRAISDCIVSTFFVIAPSASM